jgi:ABC-type molybdate transport system substrate-binding protein
MNTGLYRRTWWVLLVALTTGCNRGADTPKPNERVVAFVAASTKDAAQEIAAAFKRDKKADVAINADDSFPFRQ